MSHLTLAPAQQSLVADAVLTVLRRWPASEFEGRNESAILDRIAVLTGEVQPECRLLGVEGADAQKALAYLCYEGKAKIVPLVTDAVLAVLKKWPASEFMDRDKSVIYDRIAGLAWEISPACRLLCVDEPDVEKALADLRDQGKVRVFSVARDVQSVENIHHVVSLVRA